uniref:Caffeoyl-CoA O-methyltransferase n=1 Tax=Plectus sambesii TaxID=2011161 RepID=A0A914V135_9BILA
MRIGLSFPIFLQFAVTRFASAAIGKSFSSNDPILQYSIKHSVQLEQVQKELIELTSRKFGNVMMGAPEVVQLNQNLIRAIKAKNILDVGLFTGYSALGAALAVPSDGTVVGMDVYSEYFDQVGDVVITDVNLRRKIKTFFQPAEITMNQLIENGTAGQWDFCFIDADKKNYITYFEQCLSLLRSGGIITIDNVLWSGRIVQPKDEMDESTRAIDDLNKLVANDTRVFVSLLPIADGLTIALKK